MTINLADNNPRIAYSVAQGATQQTFAVPFEFFNDADLSVYVDGVLKAEGTDYTITGGDGSTGNVVFVTATPPDVQQVTGATGGSKVVIVRTTALERTSDFSAGADINRAALNEQLDILTAMAADLKDRADRTIQVNPHEIAPSLILPSLDSRKGKVLAFDETTGAVINGPTVDAVNNSATYAAASAASAATSEAARDAALAAYDSFDDRYLGAKASDPTLDNDGNALITGALYFSTASNVMKIYTGSAWIAAASGTASNVGFTATGNISSTNVQAAIAELDTEKVTRTSSTGSAIIPTGTQAQRDGTPAAGYFRFNSDVNKFEGYSSSGWGSVGGGAVGGGPDAVFVENDQTVTTNYTITTNKNAMSTGPITVNSGITVTVPTGSNWVIL